MKNTLLALMLIVASMNAMAWGEQKCRVRNSMGSYVYMDCEDTNQRGLRSLSVMPQYLESIQRGVSRPTPLDAIQERKMQNQQYNTQMQVQQIQQMQICHLIEQSICGEEYHKSI